MQTLIPSNKSKEHTIKNGQRLSKRAKISVMHVIYSLDSGGAETVITNYARFHNKDIFKCIICVLTSGDFYKDEIRSSKVKIYFLGKKRNSLNFLSKFYHIVKEEKVQILHLHNFSPNLWGTLVGILAGVKIILRTEHSILLRRGDRKTLKKNLVKRWLGLFQKKIICVSDNVLLSHIRKDRLCSKKYIRIYNGIDLAKFSLKKTVDCRKEFDLPRNSILIAKVARLSKPKGHEYLIQAAKTVIKKRTNVFFLIIGNGPKKEKLVELVKSMGISKNLLFLGNRKDVPQLLKSIDLFVLSSLWEGFPITIIEAMASGLPIIATDVGGNSEAIVDGENGILVPPENSKELSKAIFTLLDNKDLAENMGKKSKTIAEKKFSATQMVRETENEYIKLFKQL